MRREPEALLSGELLRLFQFREHTVHYCQHWHGSLFVMSMVGQRNIRKSAPMLPILIFFFFWLWMYHLWGRYVQMLRALAREGTGDRTDGTDSMA